MFVTILGLYFDIIVIFLKEYIVVDFSAPGHNFVMAPSLLTSIAKVEPITLQVSQYSDTNMNLV